MSRTEAAKEWGLLLRRAREGAGLSQAELARRLGLTVATISRWETGRNVPRNYQAMDISRLLHNAVNRHLVPDTDPPALREAIEQLRFFWQLSGGEGKGPAWEHLMRQFAWVRHAAQYNIPIERRSPRRDNTRKKSA